MTDEVIVEYKRTQDGVEPADGGDGFRIEKQYIGIHFNQVTTKYGIYLYGNNCPYPTDITEPMTK